MLKKILDMTASTFSMKKILLNESDENKKRIADTVTKRNYHNMIPASIIVVLITVSFIISDIATGFYAENYPYSTINMFAEFIHLISSLIFLILLNSKGIKANDLKQKKLLTAFYMFMTSIGFSLYFLSDSFREVSSSTHYFIVMLLVVLPVLSDAEFLLYYAAIYAAPAVILNLTKGTIDVLSIAMYICAYALHCMLRVNFIRSELNRMKYEEINRTLEKISMTDPLTKIGNREKFYKTFSENSKRWTEAESEMCLVMIDIDKFKNYNDTYSHLKGDECLVAVASAISDALDAEKETENVFIRFGGEEFLFVLIGNNTEAALMRIYPKLRQNIEDLKLPSGKGAEKPFVTVSLGAYIFKYREDSIVEAELKKADMQLYMVKENGRDGLGYNQQIYRDEIKNRLA